ncbi:MAG: esterase/lipase family protein [Planctomycetota bacterium]
MLGCSGKPVGLRPVDEQERFLRERRSALDSDDLSERTQAFLRRNLLDAKDLPALHARLVERHERDVAFHLAEITFQRGKESRDPDDASKCFLSSAAYAYAYLFDGQLGPLPSPYDPLFRWSCDLYDRGLGRVVARAAEHRAGRARSFRLPALLWEVEVERGRTETSWEPESYERFLVATGFEVTGFDQIARTRGIGVPVIGVREPPGMADADVADRFLPQVKLAQAVTVVARFGALPPKDGVQQATLEVLDPWRTGGIRIGEEDVPLDADFTTPIAYMLDRAPSYSGFDAMRHVERYEQYAGLFMLQPYQPDRIPVLLVHGLMSAPMTWFPLFNELQADPVLRSRYQFWIFRYPTGYPVLYSAALLRGALQKVAETYDPEGRNPAFQHMVICSHSMGGLISKLQVQTGKGRLWNAFSDTPLDNLEIPQESREMLRRALEFERLPFVTRVVFMATPHRGSKLATGLVGYIGASMITEPATIEAVKAAIRPALRGGYRSMGEGTFERATTGIGNLDPDNPIQREIVTWPFPPEVMIHSVIGNEEAAVPGGTDGVVEYWSSHLDGVASEKMVKSGHSVHETMAGIEEVRRILLLHLEQVPAAPEAPPVPTR